MLQESANAYTRQTLFHSIEKIEGYKNSLDTKR